MVENRNQLCAKWAPKATFISTQVVEIIAPPSGLACLLTEGGRFESYLRNQYNQDEYQVCSGKAASCLYVMVCVLMQACGKQVVRADSIVRRLGL
jgi:hypothetical protein